MSTTSNADPGALMSQWPHDQLTHLATHTPVPATRGVQDTNGVVGSGGIGATFSASTALNFPLPPHSAPFASAGYPHSELFRQLPPVFNNNNNTKLDPDTPLNPEGIKAELLTRPNDLYSQLAAMVNQNQRPHSALNNAELAAAQPAGPEVHAIMHHPLLSPGPRQPLHPRPAKQEPAQEVAEPPRQAPNVAVSEASAVQEGQNETAAPNDSNLNSEEQARLLLAVSQNLSGIPSNEAEGESGSPPGGSQSNGRANNASKSRTFFRAPGHEAPTTPNEGNGWVCPVCGFGCTSKFHYNSHMNTHGCHRCTICNYTSRTEGRLKKHMLDSHTAEQRQEVAALNGEQPPGRDDGEPPNRPEEGGPSAVRLPSALEQIRALADSGGVVPHDETGDDSNSTVASTEPAPQQSTPVKRSGGKPKKYECKQCKHISTTKEDSWMHNRIHIPPEKQMCCDRCPFITEYRHHLIYHMRGHTGAKPFKCSKCEYTCVNKSMLNSHMKSHTPVYQFRCQDCTYQTKYCHSLKMHTVKYNHRRVRGQVTSTGEENAESVDENMDGVETESMKNYDIPAEDLDAIERHRHGNAGQNGHVGDNPQAAVPHAVQPTNPPTTGAPLQLAPRLNALLHQPMAASGNIQQLQQFLLHQQQLGRMHEPLMHGFVPRPKCDMCEFTTNTQEELFAHKLNHIALGHHHAANQQAQQQPPMTLYGGLGGNPLLLQHQHNHFQELAAQLRNGIALRAQQPQAAPPSSLASVHLHAGAPLGKTDVNENHERKADGRAAETPEASGATTNTTASTPRVGMHDGFGEEHMSGSSETHEEAGDTSSSPSDSHSHKSLDAGSSSPHSSAHSGGHVGAKKRKAHKLELISQRLQGKNSPDNTDEHSGDEKRQRSPDSTKMNGGLAQPIPLGPLQSGLPNHQLNSLIAQFSNDIQERRANPMPYTCQHCVMGFQDQALYQIHLGFHGYELPFKCNRCGHAANTALDFNLHLYQEKH